MNMQAKMEKQFIEILCTTPCALTLLSLIDPRLSSNPNPL